MSVTETVGIGCNFLTLGQLLKKYSIANGDHFALRVEV